MAITMYDMIMGKAETQTFSKGDWEALGRGDIKDQDVIEQMLTEGYEAIEDE